HSSDYFREDNSYQGSDEICLTATLDVLKAIAFDSQPADSLLALGDCRWSPGQLEGDIEGHGWLTVPSPGDLLSVTPLGERYDAALAQLGVTRASLSATAGNA